MRKAQLKPLMVFVILFTIYSQTFSQSLSPDSASSSAEKAAIAFYNTAFEEQLHLYNGKEYHDYSRPFEEGFPYFLSPVWSKGTVNYDGNNYSNVSILYNVVSDEVIILAHNGSSKIQLFKNWVQSFALSGHTFINIPRDSLLSTNLTPGFYDVLALGRVSALVKRTKNIQTYAKQILEVKVYQRDHYYLKKGSAYFHVQTKKALLEQLSDKKRELQKYIKQNNLNFRKDRDNMLVKVIEYYNQLTQY